MPNYMKVSHNKACDLVASRKDNRTPFVIW